MFVYPNVFLFFLHVLMWDRRAREKFKLRSSAVLQTAGSQKKRNTRRALFFCYFCERIPVASDVSLCVYIKKINKYFSNVCLLRGTVRKKEAKKKKLKVLWSCISGASLERMFQCRLFFFSPFALCKVKEKKNPKKSHGDALFRPACPSAITRHFLIFCA